MVVLNCSLDTIVFWGAQTYMTTNIAHVVLCIVVVVVYLSVPELGRGLYNRAVLRHNVSLMMHGCVLALLGQCGWDHLGINDGITVFLWIVMQFFTNSTVFWLNVICFDMTLSITRFRWIPGNGHQKGDAAEDRRLRLYGAFAWGSALVPAIVAAICEYIPGIPRTFVLKPNYVEYHTGRSVTVSMYFFLLPLLTLFLNNVLFFYTTYKIIRIRRSTEIATGNQTNILKKKYFLFLRLYLLMGAPWFFGALFACLNYLVVLKMFRLAQPVLWILMLVAHKDFRSKLVKTFRFTKTEEREAGTMNV